MHASSQFTQGFAAQHSRSIFEGVSKILNQQNKRKKQRERSSSSPTEEIGSGFVPIFSHNSKNSEDSIRDGKMTTPVLENSSGGKGDSHSPPNIDNLLSGPDNGNSRMISSIGSVGRKLNDRLNGNEKPGCKCKKTKCLKLYCQCFSAKMLCHDGCRCDRKECMNTAENQQSRDSAIKNIRKRDSLAFNRKTRRGCRCVNSYCLKKYCVCFRANIRCEVGLCQCMGCRNGKTGMVSSSAHLTSGAHITVPGVRNMEIIFQDNSNGIGGQPPPTLDFLAAAVNSRKRAFPASSVRIVQSNGGKRFKLDPKSQV